MADRVELEIVLKAYQEAKRNLESLKSIKEELTRQKLSLQFDNTEAKRKVEELKREITDFAKQVASGKIQLSDDEMTKKVKEYNDQLVQAQRHQKDIAYELESTKNMLSSLEPAYKQANAAAAEQEKIVNEVTQEIERAEAAEREQAEAAKVAAEELDQARKNTDELANAAERAEARFEALVGTIQGISEALSMAASGVGAINDFGQGIFGAFDTASNLFHFNILDKALDTITSQLTQYVTGNMGRITSRYDIMNTFAQYMSLMGVSESSANASLARINESILGLPIGLDEAAYRLRRYQMFMGDVDRATDFTIGIQRSIIAGGASEQMRNQAYMQIERLLTTGELTTKRQWMSLLNGLGVSIQFIAEELGYADMNGKELAGALYSGKISATEFLGAIESLGEGTSDAAMRMTEALNIYKGTIESWASNIEFAFIRGGANTLEAINRMLVVTTDVSIVGYMEKFRDKVNESYADIQRWIDEHPESFEINFEAIGDLADGLGQFSLGDIAEEALEHTASFISAIAAAINELDAEKVDSFIAFAVSIAGPIATIAMNAGNFGLAMGVVDRFNDGYDWNDLFTKIAERVDNIASITTGILNAIPDGLMNELLAFSVTDGLMLYAGLNWAAQGFSALGHALEFFHKHPNISSVGLTLTVLAAGLYAYYQAAEHFNSLNGFDEVLDVIENSEKLRKKVDEIAGNYDKAMSDIQVDAERATEMLTTIDDLNRMLEATGDQKFAKELREAVDELNEAYPEFNANIDASTGLLSGETQALLANKEAFVEAMKARREYSATLNLRDQLNDLRIEEEYNLRYLQAKYPDIVDSLFHDTFFGDIGEAIKSGKPLASGMLSAFQRSPLAFWEGLAAEIDIIKAQKEIEQAILTIEDIELRRQVVDAMLAEQEEAMRRYEESGIHLNGTEMADGLDTATTAVSEHQKAINSLIETYEDLASSASDAIDELLKGFQELDAIAETSIDDVIGIFTGNTEILDQWSTAMETVSTYMLERLPYMTEGQKRFYNELRDSGFEASNIWVAFADAINSGDFAKIDQMFETYDKMYEARDRAASDAAANAAFNNTNWQTVLNALLQNPEAFGNAPEGFLQELYDYINAVVAYHNQIETPLVPEIPAEDLDNYSKVVEYINQVAEYKQTYGEGVPIFDMEAMLGDVDQEELDQLLQLFSFDQLLQAKDTLEGMLPDTADIIAEFYRQFAGEDEESVYAALSSVDGIVNTLYEVTMPELDQKMEETGNNMDTFNNDHVVTLYNSLESTRSKAEEVKTAVGSMATEMSNKQDLVSSFAGAVSEVSSAASAAADAVNSLAGALASINGASVSLDTSGIVSLPSLPTGVQQFASGGSVGGVFTGGDSVAAMLTPGEFVVRRRAAQALGRSFLENINRLNIPGAMDSLLKQALPLPGHFVAYNNSRSYDNHATVNQNIYTNNAAFTYRRASRFVGAL